MWICFKKSTLDIQDNDCAWAKVLPGTKKRESRVCKGSHVYLPEVAYNLQATNVSSLLFLHWWKKFLIKKRIMLWIWANLSFTLSKDMMWVIQGSELCTDIHQKCCFFSCHALMLNKSTIFLFPFLLLWYQKTRLVLGHLQWILCFIDCHSNDSIRVGKDRFCM